MAFVAATLNLPHYPRAGSVTEIIYGLPVGDPCPRPARRFFATLVGNLTELDHLSLEGAPLIFDFSARRVNDNTRQAF
jgi:hypothetical protein